MRTIALVILGGVLGGVLLAGLEMIPAEAAAPKGKDKGNAEAKARRDPEQIFEKKDKNGDGSLSLDEMKGKGKKDATKVEARFKKLDKDKNGMLSLAELKGGAKRRKTN